MYSKIGMEDQSLYEKLGKLLFVILWILLKITISTKDLVHQLPCTIKNIKDTHSHSNLILGVQAEGKESWYDSSVQYNTVEAIIKHV